MEEQERSDWLIKKENQWFARAAVNRQWAWLMGRGIIHEPDDIRPDNPAVNPALLDHLESVFVDSGYNLRALQRAILISHTYQQSFIPRSDDPALAEQHFACYPVRRMDAEVLADALCELTYTTESYMSMVPEPFTHIPADQRTIALSDGSISSSFLELFGRPSRDTGYFSERELDPSKKQCLHLLNSSHILNKINRTGRAANIFRARKRKGQRELIQRTYMSLYSRHATAAELEVAFNYLEQSGKKNEAGQDLFWALINSKEFLYKH